MTQPKILFVEDDEALRVTQSLYLQQEGFDVVVAGNRSEALAELQRQSFDVVVTDLRLGQENGIDVVRDVRQLQPGAEVLVITGYGSVDTAVEAMKEGAYDYLSKPIDPERLVIILNKALERQQLRRQVSNLQQRFVREVGLNEIVAVSTSMKKILATIDNVAQSDAPVLIEGESGTGKELMAKLIHERSKRRLGPFIGINCGAMPENLLESELFGYVRGAFTGAYQDKKGLFETADSGTLFLDEIADISTGFQVKLLRTLQEKTIRRIGDTRERPVNVRIIAASNKDLTRLVRDGRFRQDFYFRIKVIPLRIPPLRERRQDILPLAETFLVRMSERMGRAKPVLTPEAEKKLLDHLWPGNVRELENTMERALIFNKGTLIHPEDLFLEPCFRAQAEESPDDDSWKFTMAEMERRHIFNVLEKCGQNKTKAAKVLGIGYNTLWRKLKKYATTSERLD